MDWLGWTGLVATALVVPVVGFWLALRQDKIRWAREKRAELYIDLLAEAYAEKQWMLSELTRREVEEIAPGASDHDTLPELADTRLAPHARALLGARMAAFATPTVVSAFNGLSRQFPMFPRPGSHIAKIGVETAFDQLEKTIRRELGSR